MDYNIKYSSFVNKEGSVESCEKMLFQEDTIDEICGNTLFNLYCFLNEQVKVGEVNLQKIKYIKGEELSYTYIDNKTLERVNEKHIVYKCISDKNEYDKEYFIKDYDNEEIEE